MSDAPGLDAQILRPRFGWPSGGAPVVADDGTAHYVQVTAHDLHRCLPGCPAPGGHVSAYPSWGPAWTVGLPLILDLAVGESVQALAVHSGSTVDEVMKAVAGFLEWA